MSRRSFLDGCVDDLAVSIHALIAERPRQEAAQILATQITRQFGAHVYRARLLAEVLDEYRAAMLANQTADDSEQLSLLDAPS